MAVHYEIGDVFISLSFLNALVRIWFTPSLDNELEKENMPFREYINTIDNLIIRNT